MTTEELEFNRVIRERQAIAVSEKVDYGDRMDVDAY